jgi:cytochrome c oxidase assembly factor CtaG
VNEVVADEIERITPLGLSLEDAKVWYRANVLMPIIRRGSATVTIGLMLALLMCTPLEEFLQANLATHMIVEHFVLILAGFVCAYGSGLLLLAASRVSKKLSRLRNAVHGLNSVCNKFGIVSFAISALLIGYWNIPVNFDAAILAENVHLETHLSFMFAGALIFVGSTSLTKRAKWIAPIVAGKAMGLYGMFLVLSTLNLYPIYSYAEQTIAGAALISTMLVMDFTIVPIWLYSYFGKTKSQSVPFDWRGLGHE